MPIISRKLILFKELPSLLNFSPCIAVKMIWTLLIITIFMALTSDVLTLSLMKIRRDYDLRAGPDISYPKMEIVESDYLKPETSAGVKIPQLRNGDFNHRKTFPLSVRDVISDKKEPAILHYNPSNNDLLTSKAVFPEETNSQDVLAAVQKEGFLGFPKGKNQKFILQKNNKSTISFEKTTGLNPLILAEKCDMNMNLQTTTEDENNFTSEIFTVSPIISADEIKDAHVLATQELKKTKNVTKINAGPNSLISATERSNIKNIDSQTTIIEDGGNSFTTEISSELPMKILNEIQEPQVSDPLEHEKSSTIAEVVKLSKKIENELYALKRTANQQKEDEMRIKNAKYKFSTYQNDGISDLLHKRTESRLDGKVTGSYTYSDGFLLRTVNYVADENGYRVISEERVPLPGNGPKINPEGTADIKSDIGGRPVHYVVHGDELPQRTSRYQGKSKL